MTGRLKLATSLAGVIWLVSAALLVTGDWYLSCTDAGTGQPLGGIDCLERFGVGHARNAPASWFGLDALLIAVLLTTLPLLACAVVTIRVRRSGLGA